MDIGTTISIYWMRFKKWLKEEVQVEAIFERLVQDNTAYALLLAASEVFAWKIAPERLSSFNQLLVIGFGLYMAGKNRKKAIRKAAEKIIAESDAPPD